MTAPPDILRGHVVPFDGLRGLAVLLVLAEHFTFSEAVRGWSPGSIGVRTFFVLSGYLITGILLSDRDRFDPMTVARRFFRNRALRLLPPFLVAVAFAFVLGIADMRSDWMWHISYLSNVQVMLERRWTGAGHFWTLAVEQQFYVLWFPLVVLLPRRWLVPLVLCLLLTAPVVRMLIVAGYSDFLNVLLPAQVDALALGALLAVMSRRLRGRAAIAFLGRPVVMWCLTGLVLMTSAPYPGWEKPAFLSWVVQPGLVALAAASVISAAMTGKARVGLLRLPVLTGLGRISYGVYVFHYFVPQALSHHVPYVAGLDDGPEKVLRLLIWIVVTALLAAASWRWLEKPALRLKSGGVWRTGPPMVRRAKDAAVE